MPRPFAKSIAAALCMPIIAVALIAAPSTAAHRRSTKTMCRISVTVLGSGGPMHGGGRGDTAYLVRAGSRPLLLVDLGGDTPTALARAGIDAGTIPTLLISHMHPDHVSGIPDFIWGEVQAGRKDELTVIGPPSSPTYREAEQLFAKLFAADGAFPALLDTLAGKPFPMRFATAAGDGGIVLRTSEMTIRALRVVHGDLPALAFRIEIGGKTVVFAGDQDMLAAGLIDFARHADLMVAHAIGDEASGASSLQHIVATPSAIGKVAREAGIRRLVLSHWLKAPVGAPNADLWSLPQMPSVLSEIRRGYGGPISAAHDLQRYDVGACGPK